MINFEYWITKIPANSWLAIYKMIHDLPKMSIRSKRNKKGSLAGFKWVISNTFWDIYQLIQN